MDYNPWGSSVMGFSMQEYWVGCHAPPPEIFVTSRVEPSSWSLLHWQVSSCISATWNPTIEDGIIMTSKKWNWLEMCGKTWLVRGRRMCLWAWKESWFSKDHELAGALWDGRHIDLFPKWEVKVLGLEVHLGPPSGFGPQTLLVMCSSESCWVGAAW